MTEPLRLTAEQRQTLRTWQGTVVEPAELFDRLLAFVEAVEAERDALAQRVAELERENATLTGYITGYQILLNAEPDHG